jgi:PAS domain S-box-containing protein/putative nucleotidyltransferase with HDIG domain
VRFETIFQSSPTSIAITRQSDNRILDVNESWPNLTGWTKAEGIGQQHTDISLWVNHDARKQFIEQLQTHKIVRDFEAQIRHRSGRIIDLSISGTIIEIGGEPCVVFISQDITERKRRERELQAIVTVSAALRTATTRASMLPIILDQIEPMFGAESVAYIACDPITRGSVLEIARGALAQAMDPGKPANEGFSGRVIATQTAYINNDALNDPLLTRPHVLGNLKAIACVPLFAQQIVIGALCLAREHAITEDELGIFTTIADIAANAIHRVSLHEQTEQQLHRLAVLHNIDTAIASSFDLRVTLKILVEEITAHLQVDAVDVFLFNPSTLTLDYITGRGFQTSRIEESPIRLGEGCIGVAALERRTITRTDFSTHTANDPGCANRLLQPEAFMGYCAIPLVVKSQLKGVLEFFHRAPLPTDAQWQDFLLTLTRQIAIAIDNIEMFNNLQRSTLELSLAYDSTIEGWSRAMHLRDQETAEHTQRVTEMSMRLARAMGLDEQAIMHIRRGALLHDIGKVGVPDSILLKTGNLTEDEWKIMHQHPQYAYDMLAPIAHLKPALDIPYCHHEKWDGSGYPRGLGGEDIPLAARIFALADVWDAVTCDRPYRTAWSNPQATEYIREQSGKYFDPRIVEFFLEMMKEK